MSSLRFFWDRPSSGAAPGAAPSTSTSLDDLYSPFQPSSRKSSRYVYPADEEHPYTAPPSPEVSEEFFEDELRYAIHRQLRRDVTDHFRPLRVETETISLQALQQRVANLDDAAYCPTIINGNLYFVSQEDNTSTAVELPEEHTAISSRSSENLSTAREGSLTSVHMSLETLGDVLGPAAVQAMLLAMMVSPNMFHTDCAIPDSALLPRRDRERTRVSAASSRRTSDSERISVTDAAQLFEEMVSGSASTSFISSSQFDDSDTDDETMYSSSNPSYSFYTRSSYTRKQTGYLGSSVLSPCPGNCRFRRPQPSRRNSLAYSRSASASESDVQTAVETSEQEQTRK